MSRELPEGWTEVDFNELLTELRNGISTRPNIDPPGTRILRISAARSGSVDLEDFRFLPESDDAMAVYRLQDRDLLFTRYNGSIDLLGVCGMVRGLGNRRLLYPDKLMRARVDERLALPEYVEAYFQSARAREAITATAKSSAGQQGVSGSSLKEQRVPLPPLTEQRRIVAKVEEMLAQVNAANDRLAKVPAILKRSRQSVLAAACSGRLTDDWRIERPATAIPLLATPTDLDQLPDLPEFPDSWCLTTVGQIAESIRYGCNEKATSDAHGIPMLRMGNIQDGRIDLQDLKYVSKAAVSAEFHLQRGDLLFNRTNSPELVGKAAVYDIARPAVFASYLVRVRTKPDIALPGYVEAWISSPWGRAWARHVRTDGVSQSNINATKLAEMPIPLPPFAEQHVVTRRVRTLLDLVDAASREAERSAERCGVVVLSILAKAFRGELVPTEAALARVEDRDYETATQLIARVRAGSEAPPRVGPRAKNKGKRRTNAEPAEAG